MKLISWNVNGLRACLGKGFTDYFAQQDADFFCLQETKIAARSGADPRAGLCGVFELGREKRLFRHGNSRQADAAFGQNGHGQRSA